MIFLSLKNSPISSNHRNFHQNWWQKTPKIGRNYCHQNWWHFRHSKTHQFLQFTKNVTKIGEKFGENSIENSNHQNFHQNLWKFWRKFNRKWMLAPTSLYVYKCPNALYPNNLRKLKCEQMPCELLFGNFFIYAFSYVASFLRATTICYRLCTSHGAPLVQAMS